MEYGKTDAKKIGKTVKIKEHTKQTEVVRGITLFSV
jgi:hypothetical protein